MSLPELFLIAVSLSMDAFAVAACKGLSMKRPGFLRAVVIALWFGVFQAAMPILGFFLGSRFQYALASLDHWIAFLLLGIIGANMIRESGGENEVKDSGIGFKTMFPLAVATGIDALAVGVTFAFLRATTFGLSLAGVGIGVFFGAGCKAKAERTGGILLILLGSKILLEHLGLLPF